MGLPLGAYVGPANEQDRDGAMTLLQRYVFWCGKPAKIWADGGNAGALVAWEKAPRPWGQLHWDTVKRSHDVRGFKVLPRRRVAERTFGGFVRLRPLVRDYETKAKHSEAMPYIAITTLMPDRLARKAAN
jgi:transposase